MAQRRGFTLIEMLIVVMIGAVIVGMGSRQYARIASERAVANARDAMMTTAFRARSEASRSGTLVYLRVMPDSGASGIARIRKGSGEVLHELDVSAYDVAMMGNEMTLCYAPRGFALPGCTDVPSDGGRIRFVRRPDTAVVRLTLLGQIWREQ